MLDLAIALSFATLVLGAIALGFKRTRIPAGIATAVCSFVAMNHYHAALKASGGPDYGKELGQFYFPTAVYIFFMALGLGAAAFALWKAKRAQ